MAGDEAHPFDARKIWMSEPTPDLHDWSVVSLVTALRAVIQQGPADDGGGPISQLCPDANQRLSFLQQVMEELNDRGLDADSLVRYGLLREVLLPVLGTLLAIYLLDHDELGSMADRSGIDVAAWQRAFRLSPRKVEAPGEPSKDSANMQATIKQLIATAVMDVSNRIGPATGWVLTADIEDVLALRSPTPEDLQRLSGWRPVAGVDVFPEYHWLVERLSTTFLGQWDTESLHLEYRWVHGVATPPCPIEIMNARPSLGIELIAEIARRAVLEQSQDGMHGRLTAQVQRLLAAVRREDVAAVSRLWA